MKNSRTLGQAAILLAATGAFAVMAPVAQAGTVNWGPATPYTGGNTEGFGTFTGVSVGGGTGDFTFASPSANNYTANLNFNPGYNNQINQQFKYTLASTNSYTFTQAGLTSQMQALFQGGTFSKQVCSTGFGTGTCQTFTSTDTGTSAQSSTLVGFGTQIWVTDNYQSTAASPNGQITGITNTFATTAPTPPPSGAPGPLPLLGAGAAFGFSRRIRSRIKAAA
jgi:MYXO-CTERM domain-containing protein